jgi:hypothetical protein
LVQANLDERTIMNTPLSAVDVVIRVGVILLTLIAAVVHLSLLFPDPGFILNGLGYIALLAALYLPIARLARYRRLVRWAMIGYATLTLLLWVAIGMRTPVGYFTAADEATLIVLLILEGARMRARGDRGL